MRHWATKFVTKYQDDLPWMITGVILLFALLACNTSVYEPIELLEGSPTPTPRPSPTPEFENELDQLRKGFSRYSPPPAADAAESEYGPPPADAAEREAELRRIYEAEEIQVETAATELGAPLDVSLQWPATTERLELYRQCGQEKKEEFIVKLAASIQHYTDKGLKMGEGCRYRLIHEGHVRFVSRPFAKLPTLHVADHRHLPAKGIYDQIIFPKGITRVRNSATLGASRIRFEPGAEIVLHTFGLSQQQMTLHLVVSMATGAQHVKLRATYIPEKGKVPFLLVFDHQPGKVEVSHDIQGTVCVNNAQRENRLAWNTLCQISSEEAWQTAASLFPTQ